MSKEAEMRQICQELEKRLQSLLAIADETELAQVQEFLARWEQADHFGFWREIEEERKCFSHVLDINQALNSRQEVDGLLALIMDTAIRLTRAERGFLILTGEEGVRIARNFDCESVPDAQDKVSYSVARRVGESATPVLTADALNDPQFKESGSIRDLELRSILCVPLSLKGQVLGVLYLDNRFCRGAFRPMDLRILCAFADQAAMALGNARLMVELQSRRQMVENLAARLQEQVNSQEEELYRVSQMLAQKEGELQGRYQFGELIALSLFMRNIFQQAMRVAASEVPVFITGESGTGKELLAKAIHCHSKRRNGPFMPINCAAVAENLFESELFGHVKGAFSGAIADCLGVFRAAQNGTLFLDEIGDLPLPMQAKLLRALQTGEIRPVGNVQTIRIDVRVISATHRDLTQLMQVEQFRQDLYYRLRVVELHLPPLREHPEDIPLLAKHFLAQNAEAQRKAIHDITPEALRALVRYTWPGNIRQLEHEIQKSVALKEKNAPIGVADLSPEILDQHPLPIPPGLPLKEATQRFTTNYLQQTLSQVGGNKVAAAKILGLSRRGLYNKLEVMKNGAP